jgi:uncharacterized protein YegP (UPF0339 family)
MAGLFELFVDEQSRFRFRLLDAEGVVMAVSSGFADKSAAVAGIEAVRECAGMGLISDASGQGPVRTWRPDRPGTRPPLSMHRTRDRLAS